MIEDIFKRNQKRILGNTPGVITTAPQKDVSFLERIRGAAVHATPEPVRRFLGFEERVMFDTTRDYDVFREHNRFTELGMSSREATNIVKHAEDNRLGLTSSVKIPEDKIPKQYREGYQSLKEDEIWEALLTSGIGFVGNISAVPRGQMVQLSKKYGDKAAKDIAQKGKAFVNKALEPGGEDVVKKANINFPNFFGKKITPEVVKDVKATVPEIQKAVSGDGLRTVDAIKKGQSVSKYTGQLIREGTLNPDQSPLLRSLAKKYNLVDDDGKVIRDELANQLEFMASESGRSLNIMRQWGNSLKGELEKQGVKTIAPPPTVWERLSTAQRGFINYWRASLVSQLAVGTRNMGMFGYRYTMNMVDDAMSGAYKSVRGIQPPKQAFGPFIEDILAIGRQMSPKKVKQLVSLLDEQPALKTKAFQYTASDIVSGNKVTNVLTTFTRMQSYFTRTMNINAKVGAWARASGKDFSTLKPGDVPTKVWREAIDSALDMDLMAQPTNKAAQNVLRLFNDVPALNVVMTPFPRYMSNAIRSIYEFSPLAYSKFFSQKALKELAGGDAKALSSFNKASIGTMNYIIGHRVRNSEYAGEKWYELEHEGKTIDMRAFGPYLTPYLFIGEYIKTGGEGLSTSDYSQAMLGINKIAGATLFLTSQLSGYDSVDTFKDALKNFAGDFLSGFGNPAMTLKDFFSLIDDEERIQRYTKEDPLLDPFKSKIPILSQTLPERPSLFASTPLVGDPEDPALKQLTGIRRREKNFIETELDRMRIEYWHFYPKTGDAWMDRMLTKGTGEIVEGMFLENLEKSENYARMSDDIKEEYLKNVLSESKRVAKKIFFDQYEKEIIDHYADNMQRMTQEERTEYLESLKKKGLIPDNISRGLLDRISLFSS